MKSASDIRSSNRVVLLIIAILCITFASAHASSLTQSQKQAYQHALEHPTADVQTYIKARDALIQAQNIPNWSFNVTLAPWAFRKAELRLPAASITSTTKNPSLFGVLLSGERFILHRGGLLSVGVGLGTYASPQEDKFSSLVPTAFLSAEPYLAYQAVYFPNQWVVPMIKGGYEAIRYDYSFDKHTHVGWKEIPRFGLGLLVYLNIFDHAAAGQMLNNFGVKRTYLAAFYTIAVDGGKTPFDFSEKTYRLGFRFEL